MSAPPRFRFFAGKGGVGKTTCAAAAALDAAEAGRRVLAVSTDPAHSLGDALGVRLGSAPRRVRTRAGVLHAAELDADAALARWLRARRARLRTIAERGTYLDREDVARFLRLSFPGVDELVGLLELDRLARERPYEDVVVDMAPTGHTLRLLATPETLRRIASVLDAMQAKHRFLVAHVGGRAREDAEDALIREIDAQGRALAERLRDPARSRFAWILLPERASLEEAADGVRDLEAAGIPVAEILVNRVTPAPPGPCAYCSARMRSEAAVLRAIASRFRGRSVRFAPARDEEPKGLAALRGVARRLGGRSWTPPARTRKPPPARVFPARHRAPRPAAALEIAGASPRLLVFGGKGGVGKTTAASASALALAEARPSARILLLSVDPAHSLADVLGVPLGNDARPIPGAPAGLRARELDAPRVFAERRERYRRAVDELFDRLRGGSRFDVAYDRTVVAGLLDLSPPGIDEVFAVLALVEALGAGTESAPYDAVVLDTAPTGHALRLLAMPGTALEWVHALLATLLKYREAIGLGDTARDLVAVARELRELQALLRDRARTRLVAVTRAAALPRAETERLVRELRRLRVPVVAVLVNALTPPGCARCRRAAREERAEVARLSRAAVRLPLYGAPAVAPPPAGVAALRRWARTWGRIGA